MSQATRKLSSKIRQVGWPGLPRVVVNSALGRLRSLVRGIYIEDVLKSELVARICPFPSPAILLLSYPRSGSSWVGDVLAASDDIAYLREPINRVMLKLHGDSFVNVDEGSPARRDYQDLADKAFAGIPVAGEECIREVHGFAPLRRAKKLLLIKEINPLAAQFLADRYAPKVVLLLRHPAAIADSFQRLGWMNESLEDFGYHYGLRMRRACCSIARLPHRVVHYEALATDPEAQFAALFTFIGANLPHDFDRVIEDFCRLGGSAHPYNTRRISLQELDKWKSNLAKHEIESVMKGVARSGLTSYV